MQESGILNAKPHPNEIMEPKHCNIYYSIADPKKGKKHFSQTFITRRFLESNRATTCP